MSEHVLGESTYLTPHVQIRTKPGYGSGAGYEQIRSSEFRPETARPGKEDVSVYHHRLLAIVALYPDDMPIGEILDDLDGKDVHHSEPSIPEDRGVKWDNRPGAIQVIDHGRHSEITQSQMRAWAEDDKQTAEAISNADHAADRCDRCDESADMLTTVDGVDGDLCLECATETADGATIHT